METGWRNSFNAGDRSVSTVGDGGEQNGKFTPNNAWDIWDNGTTTTAAGTPYDWSNHDPAASASASARPPESSVVHALLLGSSSIHHRMPDPHMMCLKLGKRHYCGNAVIPAGTSSSSSTKRGKPPYPCYVPESDTTPPSPNAGFRVPPGGRTSSSPTVVPTCQVEGCHVVLLNAKEYYRRHKVCEIHSKAPKVVVLGRQQRFCQQCSRFHGIREFDESKRSCRRRLEGHNQRRRKGALSNSLPRNFPHPHEKNPMAEQRLRRQLRSSPQQSKPGRALSLLSSPKVEPWVSSDDLSSRCSTALYELIAANRAIHVSNQNHFQQQVIENAYQTMPDAQIWDRFNNVDQTIMTLDLMQDPALNIGLFSMKEKSKDREEWTDYCWSAFGGTNVV